MECSTNQDSECGPISKERISNQYRDICYAGSTNSIDDYIKERESVMFSSLEFGGILLLAHFVVRNWSLFT